MELKLCSPSLSLCSSSSSSSASSSSSSYACRPWLMQKTQKSCLLSFRSFPSLKIPSKIERYGHRRLLEITRIFTTETSTLDTSLSSPPTIRKLVLLRHGKSSWSDPSVKDHDRPLNEHGRSASASLASKLCLVGWLPELILCSDSARTRETLKIMQKQIPKLESIEVHFLGSFYSVSAMDGQTAQHLKETICKYAGDNISTVMCMGHNRGWEEAASIFSGLAVELKTANAALLQTSATSWQEAFESGIGGWKLSGIVKPDGFDEL